MRVLVRWSTCVNRNLVVALTIIPLRHLFVQRLDTIQQLVDDWTASKMVSF